MNNKPGQGPKKILLRWSSPFPEEAASLQLLTDTVNDIIDVQDARAPQNNVNNTGVKFAIACNANGLPAIIEVYTTGKITRLGSDALIPGTGSFANT